MSEQIRISRVVDQAKACNASAALARARQLYGTQSWYPSPVPVANVQPESQKISAQKTPTIQRALPTTSGAYTKRIQQSLLDSAVNTEFIRFFPTPCPPVGAAYLNASMPKASTACPLPNSPLNPIFPV
jgi:hypothetical protein